VEMLAHAGLSISLTAVHNMVNSLSSKAHEMLKILSSTGARLCVVEETGLFNPTVVAVP
jgi:hypothetical protein